jgi:hypothetical protein
VNAVDSWKEDLGTLLNCDASNVPIAQFNEVLKKSERWIGSLDNLIESLTSQVLTLRSAEEQWMPKHSQESGIIRGPVGTSEDLLESKDIEELIDRSIS